VAGLDHALRRRLRWSPKRQANAKRLSLGEEAAEEVRFLFEGGGKH
jgi:hypothetical protein